MIPNNVILTQEFQRQDRARIQNEAANARSIRQTRIKSAPRLKFPAWEFSIKKVRLIRTLLNPAS